jgi:uncharacterized Fe-S radical SAM superfamily protein PflX
MQIAEVLTDIKKDLGLPVICNCSGYESDEILDLLLPVVDVFLPDLKFFSPDVSQKYANCNGTKYLNGCHKVTLRFPRLRKNFVANVNFSRRKHELRKI